MKTLFPTRYGHFSPDGREYVITRPDTPKPWVNVICPTEYGAIVSQPSHPWTAGASHLYTRDFFQQVRERLEKNLHRRARELG